MPRRAGTDVILRRVGRVALLLVVVGGFGVPPALSGPYPGGPKEPPPDYVQILAGRIGPRPAGSAADRRASRYIARELEDLGCSVERRSFPLPQGGRSRNVIAVPPEAASPPALIVGAHMDTVAGSPGANDNASGVAILLRAADELCDVTTSIALVGFGAEEFQPGTGKHHIGSDAYVRQMSAEERDAVVAMVSVDMVGKLRPYTVARLAGTDRGAAQLVAEAVRDAQLKARIKPLGDISDHGPFARAGMPAAFLWTGDEPNHHQPTDRVRNVDPWSIDRGIRIIENLVENYEATS